MKAKVILNPYAGRWMALKRQEEALQALSQAGIEFDFVATQQPGQATELAAQAVRDGYSPIIAAGGDGTISEVVNGMAQVADRQAPDVEVSTAPGMDQAGARNISRLAPLGIMPLGSANDIVANLNLPTTLPEAARVIASGQQRLIDLCRVEWQAGGRSYCRYFDNNAAIGLEPFITLIQQKIHRVQGDLRYLLATLRGVIANPKWEMSLEWDGGAYSGPVTLVTVGNNPRTGGLFYVTPHADPGDGLLTFVYGFIPDRVTILKVLPRLMKPAEGSYVEHPAIHEIHSAWLKVHAQTPTPLHADGEIQNESVQDLIFSIQSQRLPILVG